MTVPTSAALAAALTVTCFTPLTGAEAQEQAVVVDVLPRHCLEPCSIRVDVRMAPDSDARALVVELDSPGFFRSSFVELAGDRAPLSHLLEFPLLPAGTYEVRAVVIDAEQDRELDAVTLLVLGSGGIG